MTAMILAAGLGSRLKPWTDNHPKALVPVGETPMLERVISKLQKDGVTRFVVNVYHFADQIIDFIGNKDFGCEIIISDERPSLLETGGAIVKAYNLLEKDMPVIVHNADILSNADLKQFYEWHISNNKEGASLLVSERPSSRKLFFNQDMELKGWKNEEKDLFKPTGFLPEKDDKSYSFSGIYILGEKSISEVKALFGETKFGIMDYFLYEKRKVPVKGLYQENLSLIDIGKPATLSQAEEIFKTTK